MAAATGQEASTICQCLIDATCTGQNTEQDGFLASPEAVACANTFSRQAGDQEWTHCTVYLAPSEFNQLSFLAANKKSSASAEMRGLISEYMERSGIAPIARKSSRRVAHRKSAKRPSTTGSIITIAAGLFLVSILLYALFAEESVISSGPHWAGRNATLILDPHTHTSFSDGALSPSALVKLAIKEGCDALVISDHSDAEGSVSDQQLAQLQALRDQNPDLLLFNGLELNMPSYNGREHAGLIASPHIEAHMLQKLRGLTERSLRGAEKTGAHSAYGRQVLDEIADYQSLYTGLLLVHNHPSLGDEDAHDNFTDITRWNSSSPVFAALEGGPGHQKSSVAGSYDQLTLGDGWDPAVATIGGAWDQLLSEGSQIWGALASSGYHNDSLDYPPCKFSRTHVIVPERSYRGVLMALKAGTFWSDHGQILNQLDFSASLEDLEKPAFPGYVVEVEGSEIEVTMQLSIERGPGSYGKPLSAEIIGNCRTGEAELLTVKEIPTDRSSISAKVPLSATGRDGESCTLRARVRQSDDTSTDLLAYTNQIRFILK